MPWLPSTGALLFFYDVEDQPWGEPLTKEPGFRVLHVPDTMESSENDKEALSPLPHHFIRFSRIDSLPSVERDHLIDLNLNDSETKTYWNLTTVAFKDAPQHQIGGFPYPIQNDDMEVECEQFVGGKIHPNHKDKQAYRAAMREAAADWKLLFQIDSDDELDVMWGDLGMIYFWVRQSEAQIGKFDNAMAIMACH